MAELQMKQPRVQAPMKHGEVRCSVAPRGVSDSRFVRLLGFGFVQWVSMVAGWVFVRVLGWLAVV
uniref:Uncharacterized protein n=1 Tax=Fagus sylvatica TaxID=28930 RepID=A0A2N9IN36_FAGSY